MKKPALFLIWILVFFWSCERESLPSAVDMKKVRELLAFGRELHHKFKLTEESISFFELALKFAPNDFNANGDLGTIYLKSNNPQKGILFLLKAVEIKPDDFIMNLNVGHTYFALHQYANCLKFLEKGIQLINNRIKKFPYIPPKTLNNLLLKLSRAYAISGIAADALGYGEKAIINTKNAYLKFSKLKHTKDANFSKKNLIKLKKKYKKIS
jgi:tetratricopeptide (TPR) repeat protein